MTDKPAQKPNDRLPPYSEEAEMSVIGSALLDPCRIIDILIEEKVTDNTFYIPANKKIYKAIGELFGKGRPIDIMTISEHLETSGELERVGGGTYIDRIIQATPTATHAEYYIEILKKKAMARSILALTHEIQSKAYNIEDPEELRGKAEIAFTRLEENKPSITLSAGMNTIIEDLLRIDKGGAPRPLGPSTGFEGLDKALGGGMGAGVNFITGEPGTGKTSLACNIILNLIATGKRVGFVTLEMSIDDMLQKLISVICDKNIRHALVGMAVANMDKIEEANKILVESDLFDIADQSSIQDEKQLASWCRRKVLKDKAEIIVLDYLQLMDLQDDKGLSEEQRVSKLAGAVKQISATLNIPLLVIGEENSEGKIRYSRRADYAGATHWRLLKTGDAEPRAPHYKQAFDVFTNKARFGVPRSKTHMTLWGATGRIDENEKEEEEYDYYEENGDLPGAEQGSELDLFD